MNLALLEFLHMVNVAGMIYSCMGAGMYLTMERYPEAAFMAVVGLTNGFIAQYARGRLTALRDKGKDTKDDSQG